ncbi:hypothetical protein CASFOL_032469 [Castilleja foliolosa]|uniref:GATA-type domain-containing protein n=1 Tax=Castilleja foliolosa TaxID=1961234 RepID=A0ABD3C1J1_9LAMI
MNLNSDIMNNDQPPLSCHVYFNSTKDHNMGYYDHDHHQLYQSHQHISDDYHNHGYNNNHGGSTYEIKNKVDHQSGLKLTLWKNEDHGHHEQNTTVQHDNVKWMSSKMRLMKKMKNQPDRVTLKIKTSASKINKLEDQTYSLETDSNNSSYSPIRVCSDCNTTKTPLWRSGPKGPKSLCNACGIRQRKARRAMAAAAAAANGTTAAPSADHQRPASLKIKVQQHKGKNGHLKKRCKVAVNVGPTSEDGSTSNGKNRIGLEDFLINLSKNLSFHRVFPEDEKDAAILLMALSSGLVHG